MRILLIILVSFFITSCKEKMPEKSLQEQYEEIYSRAVCISMSVHVEAYEKEPLNNSWVIKGISDPVSFVSNQPNWKLQGLGWRPPKEFVPNPERLNLIEVAKWCPEIKYKFSKIPY
jgi:hypothetical protein